MIAWRKRSPVTPISVRPEEIGFEKYYHTQWAPGGGRDNNSVEDFFSSVESSWPDLVKAIASDQLTQDKIDDLWCFIALMRARVPAMRDAIERMHAEMVRNVARQLENAGRLPPAPPRLENLIEEMEISIDPQTSLVAIPNIIRGCAEILECMDYQIVHNLTDISLVTSDNPIVYFDPDVREERLLPYTVRPEQRRIEFLFSLRPDLLLRGLSKPEKMKSRTGVSQIDCRDKQFIKRVNRMVTRFSYDWVFASDRSHQRLVEMYANLSPMPAFFNFAHQDGLLYVTQWVFGERTTKPKWVREEKVQEPK